MALSEICDFINDIIAPDFSKTQDDQKIKKFVSDLSKEKDISSKRLLICLGIDIKNSIAKTNSKDFLINKYLDNLRNCILLADSFPPDVKSFPEGHITNRIKFGWAQKSITLEESTPCIDCSINDSYSRVYNFKAYMRWVVDINRDSNAGIDKIDPSEIDRYYLQFKTRRKFKNLNITRLGKDGWIFVANKEELEMLNYSDVTAIIDSLGLYIHDSIGKEKFVCLEYDSKFSEQTWQPDSLTGDWGNYVKRREIKGNDFFLSYYNIDNYGRTYSISGKREPLKERVHKPFDFNGTKTYISNVENLGELPSNILKSKNQNIIKEALLRYYKS